MDQTNTVALFVYNRPQHTRRTVDALFANHSFGERAVYIFSDGPKREKDQSGVREVRKYCHSLKQPKLQIVESDKNQGLAQSIISGVSKTLRLHETIIVMEDDLVSSRNFLTFMDRGLGRYANETQVASIHGYTYPAADLPETYFLRGADCWGWATWRRAWEFFEQDSKALLNRIESSGLKYEFDFRGAYPYSKMLAEQAKGLNDSWAIRWHASAFLKNMLTLYPGKSLIENIGLDGSGTHSGFDDRWLSAVSPLAPNSWPSSIEEDRAAFLKIRKFLLSQQPWRRRILAALEEALRPSAK